MQVVTFTLWLLSICLMFAGAFMAFAIGIYVFTSLLIYNISAAASVAGVMLLMGMIVYLLVKD